MSWLPVYTRARMARMGMSVTSMTVLGLVLVLAPAPSSLALQADVGRQGHHPQHHHPVNMDQWSVRAPGDVRCYCNLPACITTGYMCKSAGKGCFSDLVDHVDVYRARHGCLDLLDGDRQRQCKNQPRPDPHDPEDPEDAEADDDVPAWEQDTPRMHQDAVPSLLLCCTQDMCNHIDSPDSRMINSGPNGSDSSHDALSSSRVGLAKTLAKGPSGVPLQSGLPVPGSAEAAAAEAAARSAELWFKAATIAVPICGALILVLLIVLAVRLLRADSQHQRASKLSACAFPALSDKKVPLLPCGTGVGWGVGHGVSVNRLGPSPSPSDCALPALHKNHALAKLNYSASYDLLDLHKDDNCRAAALAIASNNHNQRNVLLSTPSKSSYKQVLASFVPWGIGDSDPPAPV